MGSQAADYSDRRFLERCHPRRDTATHAYPANTEFSIALFPQPTDERTPLFRGGPSHRNQIAEKIKHLFFLPGRTAFSVVGIFQDQGANAGLQQGHGKKLSASRKALVAGCRKMNAYRRFPGGIWGKNEFKKGVFAFRRQGKPVIRREKFSLTQYCHVCFPTLLPTNGYRPGSARMIAFLHQPAQ